jgi:flagellar hook assembly protein FlgD
LKQNYPNPFNPVTQVEFQIPYDVQVKVSVTDITGREIRVLEDSRYNSGTHRVMWNGRDQSGKNVSAGIYLCRVQAGTQIRTGKMLLLK